MKSPREVVAGVAGVSDWIVTRAERTETQRYLVFDRLDSARTVERTSTRVAVLNDHDGGRGRSDVVLEGRDAELDPKAVEEAVFAAGLQSNPAYGLPDPAPYPTVALEDPELVRDAGAAMDAVQERILAAVARESGLRLSSAELYVTRTRTSLATSRGVDTEKTETDLFLDLVLLAGGGEREAESHNSYSVKRVADLDVEAIVARQARFARDGALATPTPDHAGPIVLTFGSFLPLFGPFRSRTSATSVYRKFSPVKVGDALFGERPIRGDRLTLVNDPTVPFATGSSPFDGEGLALGPVTVVEDGIVRALAADSRYAGYLDIPATGDWSNTSVPAGGRGVAELLDAAGGPVLEIVEFSWLNPDNTRGRFSTEVRLAYLHGSDGSKPVRGGAFAGDVYELFSSVRLSRETALDQGYSGPIALRFDGARIAGA